MAGSHRLLHDNPQTSGGFVAGHIIEPEKVPNIKALGLFR